MKKDYKKHINHFKPLHKKKVEFGKYAGTLYSEVPQEYLEWFVNNAYPHMVNRKKWAKEELDRRNNLQTPKKDIK